MIKKGQKHESSSRSSAEIERASETSYFFLLVRFFDFLSLI